MLNIAAGDFGGLEDGRHDVLEEERDCGAHGTPDWMHLQLSENTGILNYHLWSAGRGESYKIIEPQIQ